MSGKMPCGRNGATVLEVWPPSPSSGASAQSQPWFQHALKPDFSCSELVATAFPYAPYTTLNEETGEYGGFEVRLEIENFESGPRSVSHVIAVLSSSSRSAPSKPWSPPWARATRSTRPARAACGASRRRPAATTTRAWWATCSTAGATSAGPTSSSLRRGKRSSTSQTPTGSTMLASWYVTRLRCKDLEGSCQPGMNTQFSKDVWLLFPFAPNI